MTDDTRRTTYETAIHRNLWSRGEHGELNGDVVGAVIAVADAELAALRQECRDRECTEQDVRARLADAENALALVRALHYRRPWRAMQDSSTFGQSVFPDQCDHCRTAWPCNTSAALDGTS